MRKLQTCDVFAGLRMINKIGIKEEAKMLCMEANSLDELGRDGLAFEALFTVYEKAVEVNGEKEIYAFVSRIYECTPEEVETMDPVEFIQGLIEAGSPEKWRAFFDALKRLLK